MFRTIILPIFRSTRLCITACGIMHPRCCRPPAGNIVGSQASQALQWLPTSTHTQSLQILYSEFTPSPQQSTSTSCSTPPRAYVTRWFVTVNRFRSVWATLDILWLFILNLVTKKKLLYLRATTNIRQVLHMMLCWCDLYRAFHNVLRDYKNLL